MKRTPTTLMCSLITVAFWSGCIGEEEVKIELNMKPVDIGDDWEISTPEAEGFDEGKLREAYELFFSEDEFITGISLLVVRNGKLVAEGYCRDMEDQHILRSIASATKSIVSLVFGISMELGYIDSLDQTLYSIIPNSFDSNPTKREITFRHLLTLSSGIDFETQDYIMELFMSYEPPSEHSKNILTKPLYATPGAEFHYRDCDPQLISSAIQSKSGKTLHQIADEFLFGPMGIKDYTWEKNVDGESLGANGIYALPRDLAKIGKLVINNGRWKGQQLVSEGWIEQSTSYQIEVSDSEWGYPHDYGFLWWILDGVDGYAANGYGGEYIVVLPSKQLVVVMTSLPLTLITTFKELVPLVKIISNAIVL